MTIRSAVRNILVSLMLPALMFIMGCGAPHNKRTNLTTTSDSGTPSQNESDAVAATDTASDTDADSVTATDGIDLGGASAKGLTDTTNIPLEAYVVPETISKRLEENHSAPLPKTSTRFALFNQFIKVEPDTGRLTFTGMLRISGKQDEKLELSCVVDKTKDWTCTNMFPTDPTVAAQGRLQATARCIDECRDKMAGVKLFILIDGKIETSTYYSYKFKVWKATSGDTDLEQPAVQTPPEKPVATNPPKDTLDNGGGTVTLPPNTNVQEKLTPAPLAEDENRVNFEPPAGAEELTEETFQKVADDPNSAVETSPTFQLPDPTPEQKSPKGIETQLTPKLGQGVRDQSIGTVTGGKLKLAVAMPASGKGFKSRTSQNQSWGPDIMIEMIKGAAGLMDKAVPRQPEIMVCDIAGKTGGDIGHASHRNGLDADIGFPSTKSHNDMWAACTRSGTWCAEGAQIKAEFDEARFWVFLKSMVCAQGDPVRVMFIEPAIKKHMCRWVKNNTSDDLTKKSSCGFKTLRALKTSAPGHHNHVHVRLKCPGNASCVDQTWDLSRDGTGC